MKKKIICRQKPWISSRFNLNFMIKKASKLMIKIPNFTKNLELKFPLISSPPTKPPRTPFFLHFPSIWSKKLLSFLLSFFQTLLFLLYFSQSFIHINLHPHQKPSSSKTIIIYIYIIKIYIFKKTRTQCVNPWMSVLAPPII